MEDFDPEGWPHSRWKCCKVKFDYKLLPETERLNRISPWNIEDIVELTSCSKKDSRKKLKMPAKAIPRPIPFSCGSSSKLVDHHHEGFIIAEIDSMGLISNRYGSGIGNGRTELLGIDLNKSPQNFTCDNDVPATSDFCVLDHEVHNNNPMAETHKTIIKVVKKGCNIVRSVDLAKFSGYEQLVLDLDQKFQFDGGLVDRNSGWAIIYLDTDEDIMLIGDCSWNEFCRTVKKIFIYPHDDVNNSNSGELRRQLRGEILAVAIKVFVFYILSVAAIF